MDFAPLPTVHEIFVEVDPSTLHVKRCMGYQGYELPFSRDSMAGEPRPEFFALLNAKGYRFVGSMGHFMIYQRIKKRSSGLSLT